MGSHPPLPSPPAPIAALQAAGPARSSAVAVAAVEPAGLVGPASQPASQQPAAGLVVVDIAAAAAAV